MKRYLLPVIAVILMVLYFLPYLSGKNKKTLHLISLKPDEINSIVIKKEGTEYEFRKENTHWKMLKPIKWKADEEKIKRLLEALRETILETPVSDKDYEKYNIKDDGNFVRVSNGQTTQTVFVGKRGARYSLIYVKPEKDKRVYLVRARFADRLPAGENDFRDRSIFKTDPARIKAVFWKEEDKTYSLVRRENGWYGGKTRGNENTKVDSKKVKEYIDRVSDIEATGFLKDDKLPEKAKKIGFIKIVSDKETILELYKKEEDFYLKKEDKAFRISTYQKQHLFKQP